MINIPVLQFIMYYHLNLPISVAELSIKGIHVMQMQDLSSFAVLQ